jgi:hypothetical protein
MENQKRAEAEAEAARAKLDQEKPKKTWYQRIKQNFKDSEIQNFLLEKNNDTS